MVLLVVVWLSYDAECINDSRFLSAEFLLSVVGDGDDDSAGVAELGAQGAGALVQEGD